MHVPVKRMRSFVTVIWLEKSKTYVKGRQINIFSKVFTVGKTNASKAHASPIDSSDH